MFVNLLTVAVIVLVIFFVFSAELYVKRSKMVKRLWLLVFYAAAIGIVLYTDRHIFNSPPLWYVSIYAVHIIGTSVSYLANFEKRLELAYDTVNKVELLTVLSALFILVSLLSQFAIYHNPLIAR